MLNPQIAKLNSLVVPLAQQSSSASHFALPAQAAPDTSNASRATAAAGSRRRSAPSTLAKMQKVNNAFKKSKLAQPVERACAKTSITGKSYLFLSK